VTVVAPQPGRRAKAQAGFTLMEILISMTILMVGMLPMMAVFQTAMHSLNRAIEDTYSAAIAQSVVDAIRIGLKDMKVEHKDGTRFFIFDHDGWTSSAASGDNDPRTQLERDRAGAGPIKIAEIDISSEQHRDALIQRDYVILLPNATDVEPDPRGGQRGAAFLYPRPVGASPRQRAQPVEYNIRASDGTNVKATKIKIERVYELGEALAKSAMKVETEDTFAQYSFAFTIRTAKAQELLTPTVNPAAQKPLGGLYELDVRIYRNFAPAVEAKRNNPIRQFITYVAE
jgi:prepilin-type N-terminal cleavage/methylation domain-containing protein